MSGVTAGVKIEKALLGFLVVLGLTIVALIGWVLWSMYVPLNLFEAPAVWRVRERAIHAGDDLITEVKFCKNTDLPAVIGRMTLGKDLSGNEYIFNHPNITGSLPAGCHSKRLAIVTLAPNVRPGKYRVIVTIRYDYSAFRTVQQNYMTEEFDVIQ